MIGTEAINEEFGAWLDEVASKSPFGSRDRLGTANYIDDAARKRAVDATVHGRVVSLARPIPTSDLVMRESGSTAPRTGSIELEVYHYVNESFPGRPRFAGGSGDFAGDVTHVEAHGQTYTHLDALMHVGRRGTWYAGWPVDDVDGPSIEDVAEHRFYTRGVLADIPAVRGTDWADADVPVGGEDIDAALERSGVVFEPGDALLLYMGRDKFELAGHTVDVGAGVNMPGAGVGVAKWLVEHQVSVLYWDFLDAVHPSEPVFQNHFLIWAVGLHLVDNCNFTDAIAQSRDLGSTVGSVIVAPPPIPRATSALVTPMFIQ